jgi:hypothetical protein
MPDLLHEFWRDADSGGFGRVSEIGDISRSKIEPDHRFVFEIWASSWREAMRRYEERAYGEFGKSYDHLADTIYTDLDAAEQQAYLVVRPNVR